MNVISGMTMDGPDVRPQSATLTMVYKAEWGGVVWVGGPSE